MRGVIMSNFHPNTIFLVVSDGTLNSEVPSVSNEADCWASIGSGPTDDTITGISDGTSHGEVPSISTELECRA
jgi:hypothetical protein